MKDFIIFEKIFNISLIYIIITCIIYVYINNTITTKEYFNANVKKTIFKPTKIITQTEYIIPLDMVKTTKKTIKQHYQIILDNGFSFKSNVNYIKGKKIILVNYLGIFSKKILKTEILKDFDKGNI